MRMRSVASLVMAVAFAFLSRADTFFLKPGGAWDQATGYYLDDGYANPASRLPGDGDTVQLEGDQTYAISSEDAAWAGVFQKLSFVITHADTVLRITVPGTGVETIGPHVRGSSTASAFTQCRVNGCIEKLGTGELKFGDGATVLQTGYVSPFFCNLDVREGVASLPKAEVADLLMGRLTVRNGAKCNLAASDGNSSRSFFAQITVEPTGWLHNPTTRSGGHPLGVLRYGSERPESVIEGYVSGICYWWSYGDLTITSTTNSNTKGGYIFEDSTVRLKALGHFDWPDGSFGAGFDILFGRAVNGADSRLVYTGQGEEVKHNLKFGGSACISTSAGNVSAGASVIDAGDGGLYFRGASAATPCAWTLINDWTCSGGAAVRRIVLAGDGAAENKVEVGFNSLTVSGVTYPAFIRKTGKGVWNFLDPLYAERNHVGTTHVEDGTLRFASLAPRGTACALGLSTQCTLDDTTALDATCHPDGSGLVDYAFVLGSATNAAAAPVFEHSGATNSVCADRPLVLVGNGGTLSVSKGALDFSGVSARDAGSAPTLTLGGSGHLGTVRNVTDGATGASVSVEKTGSGTWTLAGAASFTGDLAVKSGRLELKVPRGKTAASAAYNWYRFSIAQIGPGTHQLYLREIALYDQDGVRQNEGLDFLAGPDAVAGQEHEVYIASTLAAGEAGYDAAAAGKRFNNDAKANGDDFQVCFNGSFGSPTADRIVGVWLNADGTACAPTPSDRSTWIPIVMHLKDGANPVTHFDMQGFSNKSGRECWPTRVLLEGSTDGVNWDVVFDNATASSAFDYSSTGGSGWGDADNNVWLSDGQPAAKAVTAARPLETAAWKASYTNASEIADLMTWYRFSIAKIGSGAKDFRMRQLCFFAADGTRLNDALAFVETPTPGAARTILATPLTGPGQIGYDRRSAGRTLTVPACDDGKEYGELDACTMASQGWDGAKGHWMFTLDEAPVPTDPSSHLAVVFRLKQADVNARRVPKYFDIQKYERGSNSATPTRFKVEGSPDGLNWTALYDNTADTADPGVVTNLYNAFLSDGTQASNSGKHHPDGDGFALAGDGSWPGETGSALTLSETTSISVAAGAELVATAPVTVRALTLNASGNGTLENFAFAATGTLTVPDVPGSRVYTPTFVGCSGLENLANWTGVVAGHRRIVAISYDPSTGSVTVRVSKPGTMLLVR